ncbi:hypothetical protein T07_1591 [Trichinella nelsoni]|uniref:Uncharacterized protein n=1 Tax=Trichinella nelsoni TaxID=6336 RepID=A0A0V0RD14_9BILA|nr:hypothetical protein T07_1591 [Trichinella nelsoni]
MHKNRFPALRYANNDRHKRCLIVKLIKQIESENADDTNQIMDSTTQKQEKAGENISIAPKPLLILRALRLSIKHITIHRKSSFH